MLFKKGIPGQNYAEPDLYVVGSELDSDSVSLFLSSFGAKDGLHDHPFPASTLSLGRPVSHSTVRS